MQATRAIWSVWATSKLRVRRHTRSTAGTRAALLVLRWALRLTGLRSSSGSLKRLCVSPAVALLRVVQLRRAGVRLHRRRAARLRLRWRRLRTSRCRRCCSNTSQYSISYTTWRRRALWPALWANSASCRPPLLQSFCASSSSNIRLTPPLSNLIYIVVLLFTVLVMFIVPNDQSFFWQVHALIQLYFLPLETVFASSFLEFAK